MGNVSLTWIFIGVAAFVATFMIATQGYTSFMIENNGTIDSTYLQKYSNIAGYNATIKSQSVNSTTSLIGATMQAVSSLVQTVFNIGLTAISSLLTGANLSVDIATDLQKEYPELAFVFWFIIIAVSLYIASRYLQSARGSVVEN